MENSRQKNIRKVMSMKKTMKKTLLSLLAATAIITYSGPVLANGITVSMPATIYQNSNAENIASGVVHEHIQRFTNNGWLNINVIRIDLTNPYVEIQGLINPAGISKRGTVSNMVNTSNAVAAVNGDYFNYQPLPSSLGTLINNGEMVSSSHYRLKDALPTFYIDSSNKAGITYLDNRMAAVNNSNGTRATVGAINKVDTYFSEVKLLNKHWGDKSMGNTHRNDLTEVLVVDGHVAEKRVSGQPFTIPQTGNAYVLSVKTNALDNFNVGDSVSFNLSSMPDVNNIKFAIGGGSIVLNNGQITATDIISKGNQPRTGIGVNKDNTEAILITIDGRNTSFTGVTQEMLGATLRDLGAYTGMNLDGGGSTTMAVKPKGEEKATVVNIPSEGSERLVVNSVGVLSNAPVGELSYLKVTAEDPKVFVNTSRYIDIKGYDANHNPVDTDKSQVTFTSSGVEGIFEGNKFIPSTSGKGKIIAHYNNGAIGEMNIEVLEAVVNLETELTEIRLDVNSQYSFGDFYGKDKNGTKTKVNKEDVTLTVHGDIGYIENGVFYSGSNSTSGAVTASVGDSIENIRISVGYQPQFINGFETLQGFNFTSYPNTVTGNISLNQDKHQGNYSLALNYDFSQGTNTRAAYVNFTQNGTGLTLPRNPSRLGLWVKGDGNGIWLRATVRDMKGNAHTVNFTQALETTEWQYVTADLPNNIPVPVTLERIYAVEADAQKSPSGTILIDELMAYYPSPIASMELPAKTVVEDQLAVKQPIDQEVNGFSFAVAAEPEGLNELVGYDAEKKLQSLISDSKIAILLNGASQNFKNGLKNYSTIDTKNAYRVDKHYDALFFSISSRNGGIRAANPSQWSWLINDLENRQESNFILFLPTPIVGQGGFTDKLEADLLHTKLSEAASRGKNVFVVHGGNSPSTDLVDGVRYIGLDTNKIVTNEDIKDISLVEFVVNGSNISYEIKKVY